MLESKGTSIKYNIGQGQIFGLLERTYFMTPKLCCSKIVTKMVGFIKTFDQYPGEFNFGHFFWLSSKTVPEGLNVKFRSKFNHGF